MNFFESAKNTATTVAAAALPTAMVVGVTTVLEKTISWMFDCKNTDYTPLSNAAVNTALFTAALMAYVLAIRDRMRADRNFQIVFTGGAALIAYGIVLKAVSEMVGDCVMGNEATQPSYSG